MRAHALRGVRLGRRRRAATRRRRASARPAGPGVRAYGAWVRGEFELAVALATRREAARGAASAVRPPVWPSGCWPTSCTSSDEVDAGTSRRPADRAGRGVGNDRGWCTPATCGAVALSSEGDYDEAARVVARARRWRAARRGARPIWRRPPLPGLRHPRRRPAALDAFVDRRPDGRRRRQPVDERLRPDRGERAPGPPGRLDAGCRGPGRDGRHLVPGRRVVAAVAHAVALRDRARPHRPSELAAEVVGAIEAHATTRAGRR